MEVQVRRANKAIQKLAQDCLNWKKGNNSRFKRPEVGVQITHLVVMALIHLI